jgi:Ketopantoate hydroxymethyltransferase
VTRMSKKVRVPDLAVMKERAERIVMLTAYDATMARLLDRAGAGGRLPRERDPGTTAIDPGRPKHRIWPFDVNVEHRR